MLSTAASFEQNRSSNSFVWSFGTMWNRDTTLKKKPSSSGERKGVRERGGRGEGGRGEGGGREGGKNRWTHPITTHFTLALYTHY